MFVSQTYTDEEQQAYDEHLKWLRHKASFGKKKYQDGVIKGIEEEKLGVSGPIV